MINEIFEMSYCTFTSRLQLVIRSPLSSTSALNLEYHEKERGLFYVKCDAKIGNKGTCDRVIC